MITRKQIVERFHSESKGLDETQQENLLRELLQEAILCHMKSCGFYDDMAFHGGTSLRILHRIDRYSEDLDFSLIKANENYDVETKLKALSSSLAGAGIDLDVSAKEKEGFIKKGWINDSSLGKELLGSSMKYASGKKLKIKFELDVNPCDHQKFSVQDIQSPFKEKVNAHDLSTCMAQKIHAVLCRGHGYGMGEGFVKGRDIYDLEWYFNKGCTPNIPHLGLCLIRLGPWKDQELKVDQKWLDNALTEKFKAIDYKTALTDMSGLITSDKIEEIRKRWNSSHFLSFLGAVSKKSKPDKMIETKSTEESKSKKPKGASNKCSQCGGYLRGKRRKAYGICSKCHPKYP